MYHLEYYSIRPPHDPYLGASYPPNLSRDGTGNRMMTIVEVISTLSIVHSLAERGGDGGGGGVEGNDDEV